MSGELCHCGQPVAYGYDGNPEHHRGMCVHCDAVRCDVDPGTCAPNLVRAAREWAGTIRFNDFTTLDSGQRVEFPSGMRRDTDAGKPRYDLIPLPLLRRLADLYARGAVKYGDSNWTLADSPEEVQRFKASAFRHFAQWLAGEVDEDHAAAVVFNIFAAETIAAKLTD